jgi:hypothetical protein
LLPYLFLFPSYLARKQRLPLIRINPTTSGIPFTKTITSWKSIFPSPRKPGSPCNLLKTNAEEVARREEEFFPTASQVVGPGALMGHLLVVVGEEVELERASNTSKLTSRLMAKNLKTRVLDLKETLLTASLPMDSKDL